MRRYLHRAALYLRGIVLIYIIFMICGCTGGSEIGNPILKAENGPQVVAFITGQYASDLQPGEQNGTGTTIPNQNTQTGYTTTNIQEPGVDESDKAVTDGRHLYIAGSGKVSVVDTTAQYDMDIISAVKVDGLVDSLYLYNNILVILYCPADSSWTYWDGDEINPGLPTWISQDARTGIALIDTTDPANPVHIREFVTDGTLVSSRLTQGRLHVIQQFLPCLPELNGYYDSTLEDREEITDENANRLIGMTIDDLTPTYDIINSDGNLIERGLLVKPQDFYLPLEPNGGSIVTISSIDLKDTAIELQSTGIITDSHLIYASKDAMYVTSMSWDISTQVLVNGHESAVATMIYKFDITGERAVFKGKGYVPGRILDQFSLSEYEDILRIATFTDTCNHVFSMSQSGSSLDITGRLEVIAPDETIYSCRFVEDRGFISTSDETEPLIILDLSDPLSPKTAGHLMAPGYCDYIHPMDKDHIITIGKSVIVQEGIPWYQGIQISIFDISDLTDPIHTHEELIGDRGTNSEALGDHKAFCYNHDRGLLAIPVELYERDGDNTDIRYPGTNTFNGLYVYRLDTYYGLSMLGRISMEKSGWTRGVFINDYIYGITSNNVYSAKAYSITETTEYINLDVVP